MKSTSYLLMLLVLLLMFCKQKKVDALNKVIKTDSLSFLSEKWKMDSFGCKNIRSVQVFESLFKGYVLEQKNEVAFLKVLGSPNKEERFPDKKIVTYYYNSICRLNHLIKDSDKSSIVVTFDSQGNYKSHDTIIE